jgi:hypothetical protein
LDALTSILLYACAAIAVAGSLGAAIAPPALRSLSLVVMTAGTVAVLAVLSAAFAAAAFLAVGLASALLLGGTGPVVREGRGGLVLQLGGVTAALLFVVLAYAALKGSFGHGTYPGGFVNSAAVARLLLDRDAMAGVAAGGILLTAIAGAAASWRTARR